MDVEAASGAAEVVGRVVGGVDEDRRRLVGAVGAAVLAGAEHRVHVVVRRERLVRLLLEQGRQERRDVCVELRLFGELVSVAEDDDVVARLGAAVADDGLDGLGGERGREQARGSPCIAPWWVKELSPSHQDR